VVLYPASFIWSTLKKNETRPGDSTRVTGGKVAELIKNLAGHWVHSFEEDAGNTEVYRPADFPFPPARFRRGFEFAPEGKLSYYGLGPADKPLIFGGRWSETGPKRIRLEFDDAHRAPETLEIISMADDVLRVTRVHD
jgi:hypothetical protein